MEDSCIKPSHFIKYNSKKSKSFIISHDGNIQSNTHGNRKYDIIHFILYYVKKSSIRINKHISIYSLNHYVAHHKYINNNICDGIIAICILHEIEAFYGERWWRRRHAVVAGNL